MKKALILFGSPHKDGNTARLLQFYLNSLEDYEFTRIDLFDIKFEYCRGCEHCKVEPNCIYEDLNYLEELYHETDLLVIASPVHNSNLSAPMKALWDRTQKYFNAKFCRGITPFFKKPKEAFLILSGENFDSSVTQNIENSLKRTFTLLNTKLCGYLVSSGI